MLTKIQHPSEVCNSIEVIIPSNTGRVSIPEVDKLRFGSHYSVLMDGLHLYHYENAYVIGGSDVVITKENIVSQDKFFRPQSDLARWLDYAVESVDLSNLAIQVRPPVRHYFHDGPCLSILGVHSAHWGHFVGEYLPSFLQTVPHLPPNTTILVPEELDEVQLELLRISVLLVRRPEQKLVIAKVAKGVGVRATQLFVSSKSAYIIEHADQISLDFTIVYNWASTSLGRLRLHLTQELELQDSATTISAEKLFLTRRSNYRNFEDIERLENLFKSNGFDVYDPAKLSVQQRLSLFKDCRQLSGIYGSSYYNLLFFPPNPRVSVLGPLIRSFDPVFVDLFQLDKYRFFLCRSFGDGIHPRCAYIADSVERCIDYHRSGEVARRI